MRILADNLSILSYSASVFNPAENNASLPDFPTDLHLIFARRIGNYIV